MTTENQLLRDLVKEAPIYFAPQYDFEGRKGAWIERANAALTHPAPPAEGGGVELPAIGSVWEHTNGNRYTVLHIANEFAQDTARYPVTIVYQGSLCWARAASDWRRSMTLLEAARHHTACEPDDEQQPSGGEVVGYLLDDGKTFETERQPYHDGPEWTPLTLAPKPEPMTDTEMRELCAQRDAARATVRQQAERIAELEGRAHTCGPTCSKAGCINRRITAERDQLRAELALRPWRPISPARIAALWSEACKPDRPTSDMVEAFVRLIEADHGMDAARTTHKDEG